MIKFVTHDKLKRFLNKKRLAVLCLLLPWSFGFAEGNDNQVNVARLQKEVLIERSKSKQKAREIERLSKENKELAEKEQGSNTSSNGGSTGNTQSSGNGQGLSNEKSPEVEQYKLSAAPLETESHTNTNMSTASSGDEDSLESSTVQRKSTVASSIQDSAISSAITADSKPENTSSVQQQNLELQSGQSSKKSAEVLTEMTNKLVDMEKALKSVEDTLQSEREKFQQERQEYKDALEQNDQGMLRLNEQIATVQENVLHLQEG